MGKHGKYTKHMGQLWEKPWKKHGKIWEIPWKDAWKWSVNHQRIGIYMGFHDNVYSRMELSP